MRLKELLEILDKHVELGIYDKDGLHIKHFYDKDYSKWSKEFLKKKVIELKPYSLPPASLAVYLEDYYTNNSEEEI